MLRVSVIVTILALLSLAAGCEKARKQAAARTEQKRTELEALYAEYAFLAELANAPAPRSLTTCDDDNLPRELRRSTRSCQRLPALDAAYARHLFQEPVAEPDRSRWSWLRKREFEEFLPLAELESSNQIRRHHSDLSRLRDRYVALFTPSSAPTEPLPERYVGWLLVVDVAAEKVRCQMEVDLAVGEVFEPPSYRKGESILQRSPLAYEERFFRELTQEMKRISEHLCVR